MAYDRKSFYAMNKKNCNSDQITYPFMDGEIVTIKRIQSENGSVTFVEVRKSADGVVTTSPLPDTIMNDKTFTQIRASLMEISKREDYEDTRYSHRIYSMEGLNEGSISCESVEEEYITKEDIIEQKLLEESDITVRSINNAIKILDLLLSDKQKKWYLMSVQDNLSDREIARREKVAHTTVSRSLKVIKKKFEKFFENFSQKG